MSAYVKRLEFERNLYRSMAELLARRLEHGGAYMHVAGDDVVWDDNPDGAEPLDTISKVALCVVSKGDGGEQLAHITYKGRHYVAELCDAERLLGAVVTA